MARQEVKPASQPTIWAPKPPPGVVAFMKTWPSTLRAISVDASMPDRRAMMSAGRRASNALDLGAAAFEAAGLVAADFGLAAGVAARAGAEAARAIAARTPAKAAGIRRLQLNTPW